MSETLTHLTCPAIVIQFAVPQVKGDDLADEVREQFLSQYIRKRRPLMWSSTLPRA